MGTKREKHYRKRKGKIYARITFVDSNGKRRDLMRLADGVDDAREIAIRLRNEYKQYGARIIDADRMTFGDLAENYAKDRLIPALVRDGRKIAGLRSLAAPKYYLNVLVEHFNNRKIKTITPADIEKYKYHRLSIDSNRGRKLSIASVNRELEVLRAVFSYAKREGWISNSPFEKARGLISKAEETRRDRILSIHEEKRLLAACYGRRSHLRPILICALTTAMRRGEILKLKWNDVDLEKRTITVIALNSKTARPRTVGITKLLYSELERLWGLSSKDPDDLVFGVRDNFKNAWQSLCREAEVEDFRFHDCRHTCITRWVSLGIPVPEIMRLSGHSTITAFSVYVNATDQTIKKGADALDLFYEESIL